MFHPLNLQSLAELFFYNSISENTPFGGTFGGLDDHYPRSPKETRHPTLHGHVQNRGLAPSGRAKGRYWAFTCFTSETLWN